MLYIPGVGQWDGKEWTYELPDGLGSVRQLADSQGYLVQRYDYSPFGEMVASEGKRTNSLRYSGEQWDSDVGLLYLRARWYDPSVGRFTTRDPFPGFSALPQTQNPYVYVNNNPINLTDPSGEVVPIPIPIVIIDVGIVVVVVVVIWGGYTYYASPHAAQNRANFASGMCELGRGIQNRYNEMMAWPTAVITMGSEAIRSGINILMYKGEYVPSGLPGNLRWKYRDAIHIYKDSRSVPRGKDLTKEICDEIADGIREGLSPDEAADRASELSDGH